MTMVRIHIYLEHLAGIGTVPRNSKLIMVMVMVMVMEMLIFMVLEDSHDYGQNPQLIGALGRHRYSS